MGRQRNKNVVLLFIFFLSASFCWKEDCQCAKWEEVREAEPGMQSGIVTLVKVGFLCTHTENNCRGNLLFQEFLTKVVACLPACLPARGKVSQQLIVIRELSIEPVLLSPLHVPFPLTLVNTSSCIHPPKVESRQDNGHLRVFIRRTEFLGNALLSAGGRQTGK